MTGGRSAREGMLLILLLLAAVLYFRWAIVPWEGVITSDDAIPYLMTREPWRLQDFYFWRAMRFGSVFVTSWKLFGIPVFGSDPAAFYLAHGFVFFVGTWFWWLALEHVWQRILFSVSLLPLDTELRWHFLLPGSLYGMVFLLSGIAVYLLSQPRFRSERREAISLGVATGILYWQHELVGLLVFLVAIGMLRTQRAALFSAWLPGVCFAEVMRQFARVWPVDRHHSFVSPHEIANSVQELVSRGIPFLGSPELGWLLLLLLLAGGTIGWRAAPDRACMRRLRLAKGLFAMVAASLVIIELSGWHVRNDRVDRHFLFLIPFLVWSGLALAACPVLALLQRAVVLTLLVIFASTVHVAAAHPSLFSPAEQAERRHLAASRLQRIDTMREAGCRVFLGDYWSSYVLVPISRSALSASALEFPRNPELHARLLADERPCVDDRFEAARRAFVEEGRVCRQHGSFWLCEKEP